MFDSVKQATIAERDERISELYRESETIDIDSANGLNRKFALLSEAITLARANERDRQMSES